jgi:transposase InsO family protein
MALFLSMENTMPWKEVNTVDLRREFVRLAIGGSMDMSTLCQRYGISRKTGYKWLDRYAQEGDSGLFDRSRCPHRQPRRTPESVEQVVLGLRQRFPDWGGRKLARVMRNEGHRLIPSPSTITEILRRHGVLHPAAQPAPKNYIRFEHPYPNDLWQMDFKGAFPLPRGHCHPLTVLDDHSRFSLCLAACQYERTEIVKSHLIGTFERYGLPLRMTMDNGSPWGSGARERLTQLSAWLIEQGITVSHSRPYHPQTQGKDERFHRTLNAELIGRRSFTDLQQCQQAFDPWRYRYNTKRPHEALNMDTPIEHYQPSVRTYQRSLPQYEYAPGDQVRKVGKNMTCSFKYYNVIIGQALKGKYVAFRPTRNDGEYTIHFCHQQIGRIDLSNMSKRNVKGHNTMTRQ